MAADAPEPLIKPAVGKLKLPDVPNIFPVEQTAGNRSEQSNSNSQVIYQISVGGRGDQAAMNYNDQDNDNATAQEQTSRPG